jgi:AmmeMemoRadiSam system protein B/AmmeMemoRadiSam system protein A
MKTVSIILVTLIFPLMNMCGQQAGHDRQPAVAGSFYPSGSNELRNELAGYFGSFAKPQPGVKVRAVIVPHAGYVYSGHTAAAGFAAVPSDAMYDNIFLIGASHRYAFDGAAVFCSGNMVTPLGTVQVNRELGQQLISSSRFFFERDDVHIPEHSLEVELPFIQYHFSHPAKVVPILLGTHNISVLKAVASGLKPWFNEHNLFVISSDFSHYPSYNDARTADKLTSNAILTGNPDTFLKTVRNVETSGIKNLATAMCGQAAGLVLLYLTEGDKTISIRNVEYRNSGDMPYGDKSQVVGYNAIVFEDKTVDPPEAASGDSFSLTAEERKTLLEIARDAISSRLKGNRLPAVDAARLTPRLKEPLGAFVTLTIKGDLRGCIGRFTPADPQAESSDPLWKVVSSMAVEAAFGDPRFPPLTATEYPGIHIEISVLGPMKKISDINEIKIGKHGIYLKKGYRSGTLLPQVASERRWSVTDFLGYCARDKAGIGWDGWKDKDTEIFIYEAYVFGE